MSYESWRISFQSSEQAARSAFNEVTQLKSEILHQIENNKTLHSQGQVFARERDELKAQVEQLREAWIDYSSCGDGIDSALEGLFKATPAQCLAEVKAQAVEDAISATRVSVKVSGSAGEFYCCAAAVLNEYASQLRQAAKGGE